MLADGETHTSPGTRDCNEKKKANFRGYALLAWQLLLAPHLLQHNRKSLAYRTPEAKQERSPAVSNCLGGGEDYKMALNNILRAAQRHSKLACNQSAQLFTLACLHTELRGGTQSVCTPELAQATSSREQTRQARCVPWLSHAPREA